VESISPHKPCIWTALILQLILIRFICFYLYRNANLSGIEKFVYLCQLFFAVLNYDWFMIHFKWLEFYNHLFSYYLFIKCYPSKYQKI
jgi:hypothetical protein